MVEPTYKSRNAKASPLYQSILAHFSEFESVYEERYQKGYGVLRDVVREVVYKYLGCGDLKKGFNVTLSDTVRLTMMIRHRLVPQA